MRVHIATDHAGLELSHHLMEKLTEHGYEMIDHGPVEYDAADDYPALCISAALGTAKLAREHNDAQVMALGGRQHEFEEALGLALTFLAEPFSGDERHVRRIAQLGEYERTGDIAGKLSAVTARPFTAN